MKLHYFKDPNGNFGDDLNAWLWPRVAPGLIDDDDTELFVGIGTLINHRLPQEPLKHVMGSGVGYGRLPTIDGSFAFHAVRGYGSARALGLAEDAVVGDAAVLLRAAGQLPPAKSRARTNIVLTGESLMNFDWRSICEAAEVGMISCHEPVEEVISAIRGSDLILAEAMHGAIAADTLRVPWIAVTCNKNILGFKWEDWLSSIGLPYDPVRIEPLVDGDHGLRTLQRIKRWTKLALAGAGIRPDDGSDRRRSSTAAEIDRAIRQLRSASSGRPQLSALPVLDRCVERFQERIHGLQGRRNSAIVTARSHT